MSSADTPLDKVRRVLSTLLGLAFLIGGIVIGGAGLRFAAKTGDGEDAIAAAFIGGMLTLVGVLILWAVRKKMYRSAPTDEVLDMWERELNEEERQFRERQKRK